ncbi:MAG: hypothetical protein IJW28_02005 [Clostridia bacterium]|nr:hypothetical protein [Clostridia bacterium]
MQGAERKTKDMIISIICIVLSILCIVFYFLPAFSIKHSVDGAVYLTQNFSGFDMTSSLFADTYILGTPFQNMIDIRNMFTYQTFLAGVMLPLGVLASIATAVFTTLSWLKDEKFKQFAFLTSICDMFFVIVSLISTWLIAMNIHSGVEIGNLYNNKVCSMGVAAFVGLILAFVIAIVACAYYYFLDEDDEEEYEEDEDEEYDDEYDEEDETEDLTEYDKKGKKLAVMMESSKDQDIKK